MAYPKSEGLWSSWGDSLVGGGSHLLLPYFILVTMMQKGVCFPDVLTWMTSTVQKITKHVINDFLSS